MNRVFTRIESTWDDALQRYVTDYSKSKWYYTDGPFALCCGANDQQKQIETAQQNFYNTMTKQAQDVFGMASSVFNDLQSSFAPIVAAGPNQEGFSSAEKQNLDDTVINSVGNSYKHAADAVNSQLASQGGGDVPIISSSQNQVRQDLARSAASQEASDKEKIVADDYATGRQNFYNAAGILSGSTSVFNPATGVAGAATGAGSAAANTADEIAQADNSWVNATIGALGSVAGSAITGGMTGGKKKGTNDFV